MALYEDYEMWDALEEKDRLNNELKKYKKAFEDAIADIVRTQTINEKCPACFHSRICNDDVDFDKCFEKLKSEYLKDAEEDLHN